MTEQNLNPSGNDIVPRAEDGTWLKGAVPNPQGKNGNQKGWQPMGQRIIALANKYSAAELKRFAEDEQYRDENLSYWDGLCVVHMARAMHRSMTITDSGADQVHKERESIINRIEGSPVQTIRTSAIAPPTKEEIENMPEVVRQELYSKAMKA